MFDDYGMALFHICDIIHSVEPIVPNIYTSKERALDQTRASVYSPLVKVATCSGQFMRSPVVSVKVVEERGVDESLLACHL
jgi:hypothetical protein